MKILFVSNVRFPTEKAHGLQIMSMCKAFISNGNEVELVVPARKNKIKIDPFEYYGSDIRFNIKRLPTIDLGNSRVGFWLQTFSFSISAFMYAFFNKASIVYSRDEVPLMFLSYLRKKTFFEIHTNRFNFFVRCAVKWVTGIVFISKGLQDFFVNKGVKQNKTLVAHDAVDLSLFEHLESKDVLRKKLNIPLNKKIIGYVGKYKTMGKEKGIDMLIQAFSKVVLMSKDVLLMIVGVEVSESQNVHAVAKSVGLSDDQVLVVTHRPHKEAMQYLKAQDIVVMNYPDTEHYRHYMSPLKMFEYMASGNVVVTSDLPSVREVLHDDSAVFFKADDNQALTIALLNLINNPKKVTLLANKALEDVQEYTWKKRASLIIRFMVR